jgi:hypothetical protein
MDDSSRSRVRRDSTSGSDTKTNKRKVTVKKEIMDDDDGKDSDSQDYKSKKAKRDIQSADSDSKEDDDPPADEQKGRNFNLSQLRSEMKGFDKAIKTPDAAVEAPRASEGSKSDSSLAKESKSDDSMDDDDIYEFKEPEPFKPESRLKREPVSDESKFKPTKQSPSKQDSPAAKRKFSKKDKSQSIDLPTQEDKRKRRTVSKPEEIVIEKQEWSAGSGDSKVLILARAIPLRYHPPARSQFMLPPVFLETRILGKRTKKLMIGWLFQRALLLTAHHCRLNLIVSKRAPKMPCRPTRTKTWWSWWLRRTRARRVL